MGSWGREDLQTVKIIKWDPVCRWWIFTFSSILGRYVSTCYSRADSRFVPSQWETMLQSNTVSHWLGESLDSAMYSPVSHKSLKASINKLTKHLHSKMSIVCSFICHEPRVFHGGPLVISTIKASTPLFTWHNHTISWQERSIRDMDIKGSNFG